MDDTRIAGEVLSYLVSEGVELGSDLGQVEAAVQEHIRRIGARAVELHLAKQKLGYQGACRSCGCGGVQRFVEHRPRRVQTLMGMVEIRRAYYRCKSCGESALPYDQQVGLGSEQISVGMAKAATLLGIQEPFELAARTLYELTGQRLSERTVERLTERAGQVAAEQESRQAGCMATWKSPPAEAQPKRLYIATDGVMVHRDGGWHEAKCVTCYWDDADDKRHARYAVRFEDVASFVGHVWALACRCGLESAKEVILLGDGAKWIWERIGGLLKGATLIVDWYHAMEHVWACGRELHGEGTDATRDWVKKRETLLWEGNVRGLLRDLRRQRSQARGAKRTALEKLITYVENQDDRLAYDRFRARGLDIGSGRVEAACKHVVAIRMKRNGMRWSAAGAQHTLSLRAVWMNGQWSEFWEAQPLAQAA